MLYPFSSKSKIKKLKEKEKENKNDLDVLLSHDTLCLPRSVFKPLSI